MSTGYEIRSVADFFKVPEDKRQHCLQDFDLWMRAIDEREQLFNSLPNVACVVNRSEFVWIDDGRHDAHEHLTVVLEQSVGGSARA